MKATDTIIFRGHPLISAVHKSTLMFTKEEQITSNGDCVIGVRANKACSELNSKVKQSIRINDSKIEIMISVKLIIFLMMISMKKKILFLRIILKDLILQNHLKCLDIKRDSLLTMQILIMDIIV